MRLNERLFWLRNCTGKQRKAYHQAVRDLGCCVCGSPQADLHHLRGHGYPRKRELCPGIPLCHINCHQGRNGIHGGRKSFEAKHGTVEQLLKQTEARIE
jgi:hypothetical protein